MSSNRVVHIPPIPRPCAGCGVGEAERHVDNCPEVIAAMELAEELRRRPKTGLVPITLPDERYSNLAGGVGLAYATALRETA